MAEYLITTLAEAIEYVEKKGTENNPAWEEIKRLAQIGAEAEAQKSAFEAQFPPAKPDTPATGDRLDVLPGTNLRDVLDQLPNRIRKLNQEVDVPDSDPSRRPQKP